MPFFKNHPLSARIYLLTPNHIHALDDFSKMLSKLCTTRQIAAFQIRLKNVPDQMIKQCYHAINPILKTYHIPILINDRVDLTIELDADGVHLGEEDTPYEQARAQLGKNKLIGVSCYNSRKRALNALESGADYVAFGAFYPTKTKQVKAKAETELLKWWKKTPCQTRNFLNMKDKKKQKSEHFSVLSLKKNKLGLLEKNNNQKSSPLFLQKNNPFSISTPDERQIPPCVAIGGITPEKCENLLLSGADFLAVSSSIWSSFEHAYDQMKAFQFQIEQALKNNQNHD